MRNVITSFLLLATLIASGQSTTIESLSRLYQSRDFDSVIEKATAFRNSDPGNAELSLLLGRAYADKGNYKEAVPYLDFTVTNDSNNTWRKAWALGYLGTCYFMTEQYDKSRTALVECIHLDATKNATDYAERRIALFGFDDSYKQWNIVPSDHFYFHFQKMPDKDMQAFVSSAENAYKNINDFFQSTLPKKIDFFVWGSREEAKQILKVPLGFSDPRFCIVHAHYQQTKGHEMTHVISHYSGEILTKTELINEGTAACFDQENQNKERIVKDWIKANNKTIAIKDVWISWKTFPEEFSYPLSALFVRNLINKFGKAKFIEFFRNQTYENAKLVFGGKFDESIHEFEDKINTLETLH